MVKLKKEACVGCGVCADSCSAGAIRMEPDEEGFSYPSVDREHCTDCGTCEAACPVCAGAESGFSREAPIAAYAAWARDEAERAAGSSGGIFGALAREMLDRGGWVAGAAYTPGHRARHRLIHDTRELPALRRSKYLQSDAGVVYAETRRILDGGERVLFVGTPCQCAGLLSFLGGAREGLLLCDFVCHGVNSPAVHQRYLSEVERTLGAAVTEPDHRDKGEGWQDYRFSVSDGAERRNLGGKRENPFLRGFLTDLYLRPSCYACPFKGSRRPTDLTLGDCWGYPEEEPGGVSLVLVQSEKGARAWEALQDCVVCREYPLERAIAANPSLLSPAKDSRNARAAFFSAYGKGAAVGETVCSLLPPIKALQK